MRSKTEYLFVKTKNKIEFIDITERIEELVAKSGIDEGFCLINPMHITSSVFINDAESGLIEDFKNWLEKLAPKEGIYNHNLTGEDNAFSHLWRTIMGREVVVAITKGKLDLGRWERIFYGEFDGQREKKILIKAIGQ